MARIEIKVPDFAEGAKSIKLRQWLVRIGDDVKDGEVVAEASTDKINVEIESPAGGKIVSLLAEEGDKVEVGQTIAEIEA